MNFPRWLVTSTLVVLLLTAVGITVYASVDVEGGVSFVEDTTIDVALAAMDGHNVSLLSYGTESNGRGVAIHKPLDGVIDLPVLVDDYWRSYAGYVDDFPEDIARFERNFETEGWSNWQAQKAEMLAEIDRFANNESGCWDRGDCPYFEVSEFLVSAPVATLSALESDPVVAEVGWFGRLDLSTAFSADLPNPATWVPSGYIVTGKENDEETRKLVVEFAWEDDDALSWFDDVTSFRTGVILNTVNGLFYTDETTFFGIPRVVEWNAPDVPRPILVKRAGSNEGQEADFRYGSMMPESFEKQTRYIVTAVYTNGDALLDTGEIVAEPGTRICRWAWCGRWNFGGLSFDRGQIVLPAVNEIDPFVRIVNLPFIAQQSVSATEAGEVLDPYPAPVSAKSQE